MQRLIPAGLRACATAVVLGVLAASPASAQQSLNLYLGGVTPRAEDARVKDDVLVNNLDFLAFSLKDFNAATFGAEYLVGFGDLFEGGLGVGYYQRSAPSVYLDVVNANNTEIEQTLKLRVVPFTATVRFMPFGHHAAAQPYIGAGVGVLRWRYSEAGQWVDFRDNSIFRQTYVGSGAATGPVVLGGVRVPIGTWAVGGELRYQSAEGDLPSDQNFAGSKIDLGGFTYSFTVNVRF